MMQLLLNKTTPPFQLLPMPKVGTAFTVSEKSSNICSFLAQKLLRYQVQ